MCWIFIAVAVFLVFVLVIVFFIQHGAIYVGRFRIVQKFTRTGISPVWNIQQRFLWIWWHWNCAGEYWDGDYENEHEAKTDFHQLVNKKKKKIINPE